MSIYVCSDLHGCSVEFFKLLEIIDFKEEDYLYIIGDIFDRGPNPLEIYDYIKEKNNIHFIIGNHEQLFIELFRSIIIDKYDEECYQCWVMNGGDITLKSILKRGRSYAYEVYYFLKQCPYKYIINNFVLVHAGIKLNEDYKNMSLEEIMNSQDEETLLWDREFIENDKFIEGVNVIVGHTPTMVFDFNNPKIIHKEGKILIDCGVVYGGKLGCLRLDDMKEFYVYIK